MSGDDPTTVTIIVNGPLQMSAGKLAAQTFQACQRLLDDAAGNPDRQQQLQAWRDEGTLTITREAQTPAVFERACRELGAVMMIDEGVTEVPAGSCTALLVGPIRRSQAPKLLSHKRIPLMKDG